MSKVKVSGLHRSSFTMRSEKVVQVNMGKTETDLTDVEPFIILFCLCKYHGKLFYDPRANGPVPGSKGDNIFSSRMFVTSSSLIS